MLKNLVLNNRSYRRFYEEERIGTEVLRELVDLARLTPSSVNWQPLRYKLVCEENENEKVFETLAWAGMLKDWPGPEKGERPSAYVVILTELSVAKNMKTDVGIAAQTIMLGAVEKGYGGCMIGSVNREKLSEILGIDTEKYSIDLVLALGNPKETVKLVEVGENGSTAYFRDENAVHYVPKRSLDDIII